MFYNELEEWLSGQTKVTSGLGAVEGSDQSVPVYIQALLEQTADSLDNLQRVISRGEEGRISANANMRALTDKLSTLADQMKTEQSLMLKLAEHQLEMKPILARLAEGPHSGGEDQARAHVRNIDMAVNRIADDIGAGRDEVLREIRSEFRLLARTIAAIADDEPPSPPPQQPAPQIRLGRADR
jgi:hypothetical protein